MHIETELYSAQVDIWPKTGKHIVAQYDEDCIVVYQAFCTNIGQFAVQEGYLGGSEYSLNRMSWIKPNFLWMMYRSGWGTKEGQEVALAIWLKRATFDLILAQAVPSSFTPKVYGSRDEWADAVAKSEVRLQWDPDHNPSGNKLERRAIQLGLRGTVLRQFAQGNWIAHIEDISDFVVEQRSNARAPYPQLVVPRERVYPVTNSLVAPKLQMDNFE